MLDLLAQAATGPSSYGNITKFLELAIPLARLKTITAGMITVFQIIAFPLCVYGMIRRLSGASKSATSGLKIIGQTIICVGCISACSWFVSTADSMVGYLMSTEFQVADVGTRSGRAVQVLQPNYDQLYKSIAFLGTNVQGKGSGTSYNDYSVYNPYRYWKQASQSVSNTADKFNPEYWVGVAITYLMAIIASIAVGLMQALLFIQQAIIILSTMILPVFLAFLVMGGSQEGIGVAFIRTIWGVLCWPLGWGIVNIGAQAGLSVLSTSTDGGVLSGLALLLQFALVGAWMIVGTAAVPFAISGALTRGANAVSRMAMNTASTVGGGAAKIGGAVGSAVGGIAGGGGVAGALMGGTKGAIVGGLVGGPGGAVAGAAGGAALGAIPMGGGKNGKAAGRSAGSLPGRLIESSTKHAGSVE